METHITDITRVIQLAVAPVFLLTAIGTFITALNNRLGRAVDRRRIVQERLHVASGDSGAEMRAELGQIGQRTHLIYLAILAAVTAALLTVERSKLVAVLFVSAMCALIVSLGLFLREIFLAVSFGRLRSRR
jgi:hypothetical protein